MPKPQGPPGRSPGKDQVTIIRPTTFGDGTVAMEYGRNPDTDKVMSSVRSDNRNPPSGELRGQARVHQAPVDVLSSRPVSRNPNDNRVTPRGTYQASVSGTVRGR